MHEQNNIRKIILNPENEHYVPILLQDGVNIITDLTKIPAYNTVSCCSEKIPKPMYFNETNVNFTPNSDLTKPILEN